jgi:hypothetical protein
MAYYRELEALKAINNPLRRYTNVDIMNGDGQASAPEAAAMGGEFEAGFALLARASSGLFRIRALPCAGRQEARAG